MASGKMKKGAGGAVAGPTTRILDLFADADGTLLTAHTIAPTNTPATSWSNLSGTVEILSNRASCKTAPGNSCLVTVASGVADCVITAVLNLNANFGGLIVRATDASHCWLITRDSGDLAIYKLNGASVTRPAGTAVGWTNGIDYVMEVTLAGSVISVTLDGAHLISTTDSFNATATIHGLYFDTAASVADSFQIVG